MYKKIMIALLILLGLQSESKAQHIIRGQVLDASTGAEIPLIGAFVRWQDNESGVYAKDNARFEIEHKGESPYLVVSYVGYTTDTFHIMRMNEFITIYLSTNMTLGGATVRARRITYGLNSKDPKFTIKLDEREFQKAACCNLSESFENAPAIDVSIGDAVTGTKQIKMLGLDGFYTLISKEYMPAVRTLNSYFGMGHIPAAWVSSIQITKGAGSVVNGHESIAGQINIQMKEPFDAEKFMLDQFFSQAGRSETDLMYRHDINKYVATSGFARIALYPGRVDNNDDGFMDMAGGESYSLMNRWKFYSEQGWEGIITGHYTKDDKDAGEVDFFKNDDPTKYGITILNESVDAVAKIGKTFKDKPFRSFGSQFQFNDSKIESRYGGDGQLRQYSGNSRNYYGNLLWEDILGNTFHTFQTGLSFLGDQMSEQINGLSFNRTELISGGFFEYTYRPSDTFSVVLGLRGDYNNLYGFYATPRIHTKYRFNNQKTALRASAGTGRRTSNLFAQNQFLLPSQRQISILTPTPQEGAYGLEQEVALNTGISLEHQFKIGYFPATLILDYFHTSFYNEVVVDREVPGEIRFYNMEDGTVSNSWQAQLDLNPLRRTELRFAYRYFDVVSEYQNYPHPLAEYTEPTYRAQKPFVAQHRAFFNLTQKTRNLWQLSTTLNWTGKQRIPGSVSYFNGDPLTSLDNWSYSNPFFQWSMQLSKQFKDKPFEVYLGMENITNYRQEDPILFAQDVSNPNFDAGLVWGPIFGRMLYGGFRWRIKKDYNEGLKHSLEDHDHGGH